MTGTRIKSTTFTSSAPMAVITAEQAQLLGEVDTSQILQLSPVAANAVQINNFFSGFVVTGGPGVNTLSLRGLGAQRTLFLLNGERLGPAGVGGTVGPFDLNVLPASIIDHIEILKDGASSIYGSDAVAGVVNVITKTTQDGGEIHAHVEPSQEGGGNIYQVDGSFGKTWDRGYVTAGFDYYRQDPLYFGQRGYLSCAQDLVTDSTTGALADLIDPVTGKPKCSNIAIANSVVDLAAPPSGFQEYLPNKSAVAGGGPVGLDMPGFQAVGLIFPGDPAATRASAALLPTTNPLTDRAMAISPVSRYTFTLFGGYDVNPHTNVYGSFLFNQRDSAQNQIGQFFVVPLNPSNPFNTALGPNPGLSAFYGVPISGFGAPVPVIVENQPATQTVNYFRGVVGVKGDLPNWRSLTNWTYDVFGQISYSSGDYSQVYEKADRVSATAGAGAGTNGCDVNNASFSNESMAQLEPGVACVPVNYIAAAANGFFTPQEAAFLYSKAYGHTDYTQMYVDGSATGDLMQLPAGPLGAAIGFQLRRESLNDTPAPDFINQNVYNFSTTGITKGSENVEELYAEVKVPVLKGLPLIYALSLDGSGRYSNYSSYGSNFTYKGTVDWDLTNWFKIRGTYGTAFRAPALYELFLANQTSFLNQFGLDPCINYLTQPGLSPVVRANCGNAHVPANLGGGAVSPTYDGSGAGATILAGGGSGHLKAETSIADTIGFVFTPTWHDMDLSLAVDYYNYDIVNQIAQFGAANIVGACYSATDFPNNPFCSLIQRNSPTAASNPSNIAVVNDDFVNVAKETNQGLDVDIRYHTPLPRDWRMTIESSLAWTFYTQIDLLGGTVQNVLGSIGQPKWVGNIDWRFDKGPWTFNWYTFMVGYSSDETFFNTEIFNYNNTGENVIGHYKAPFYTTNDMSIRRKFDKFTVEFGVKNIFNQTPPLISVNDIITTRIGSVPLASQYDLIGRSFFFDISAKF
ncbi:MAG TPA: TonB-dependent receptor [Caulobacteraceae bacterium]|nr:TonB-dependent receptor [Caulobacteraceae bacterium]